MPLINLSVGGALRILTMALSIQACSAISSLKIDTTVRTVYSLVNRTHPDVAQFLGIPFAEPPVGDRRWMQSVAKSPVEKIDATSFSPSYPHQSHPPANNCSEKLLVIIEYQIPTPWVQRSQEHIVVQVNYRLNIFGNPHAAGINETLNLGLLDQLSGILLDSSSAIGNAPSSDPRGSNFAFLAGQFGCGNMSDGAELACMKNVSFMDIEAFLKSYQDNGTSPSINFTPVVDNVTRFANYTARALAGNFSKVNPICSKRDNVPILLYRQLSNISPRPWQGAYHSSELPLIFGTHDIAYSESTPFEFAVSHRMQDLWLAFMKDPVNGLPSQGWEAYKPEGNGIEFAWDNQVTQTIALSGFDDLCNGTTPIRGAVPPDHVGLDCL
ncbi:Alpha/Beta hydrolase protein [Rhexocercosporidium sp. MPI-PUGE-AT-0058]|nr:Alpha/Beta hydrolase protein [Rhexocercosporidium sp. MPI-PUGE-AT-0058]